PDPDAVDVDVLAGAGAGAGAAAPSRTGPPPTARPSAGAIASPQGIIPPRPRKKGKRKA
ncbi:MAG: hypothetical protein H0W25_16550, partial [Acidimicrobiia bacterium]|nr:hypothetical protein [Acidimicrobiia bacterium]